MNWEIIITAGAAAILGAGGIAPVIVAYMTQRRQVNLDANAFASENYKQVLQRITNLEVAERECLKDKERMSGEMAVLQGRVEEMESLRREVTTLREQMQQLKWVNEAVHVNCGVDGIILSADGVVEDLLGWERDELVGKPIEILMPKYARNAHREAFAEACKPDGVTRNVQLRDTFAITKNGASIPVTIVLNSYDNNGVKQFDAELHRRF